MCLLIREVPTTKRDGLVVKCRKLLHPGWTRNDYWLTYFRHDTVPRDGLLVPHARSTMTRFYWDQYIDSRFIHAFLFTHRSFDTKCEHDAFAIEVVAYGVFDLCARAMYIPDCDQSGERDENVAFFEGQPIKRQILKRFPKLKKYLS